MFGLDTVQVIGGQSKDTKMGRESDRNGVVGLVRTILNLD